MMSIAIPLHFTRRVHRRRHGRPGVLAHFRTLDARPWNVALLALFVALTIGYLALVNGNATAGYEVRAREERAAALRDNVRALEIQTLATGSEERLTSRIADQGYVPVAQVRYLAPERAVVRR